MPVSHHLLRSLQRSSPAPQSCLRRTTARLQTRHASDSKTPAPNLGASKPLPGTTPPPGAKSQAETKGAFKSQLYDSTAARTAKEREDRERHANERQEYAGGRNLATTFGECYCWLTMCLVSEIWLGDRKAERLRGRTLLTLECSYTRLFFSMLLHGHQESSSCIACLHSASRGD
jgi:hypothetical protein